MLFKLFMKNRLILNILYLIINSLYPLSYSWSFKRFFYLESMFCLGITAVVGGRPKPSPCLKLFSFLYPKSKMDATVQLQEGRTEVILSEVVVHDKNLIVISRIVL